MNELNLNSIVAEDTATSLGETLPGVKTEPTPQADTTPPLNLGAIKPEDNDRKILDLHAGENPATTRRNRNLASKVGLPESVVASDPETAQRIATTDDLDAKTQNSPRVRDIMLDSLVPVYDDVDALVAIEDAAHFAGNALKRGGLRVEQGFNQFVAEESAEQATDASRSFGEILGDQSPHSAVPNPFDLLMAGERFVTSRLGSKEESEADAAARLKRVGEIRKQIGETKFSEPAARARDAILAAGKNGIGPALEAAINDPLGTLAFSAEVGLEFTPQLAVATAASVAGGPVTGAVTLGTLSGLTERFSSPADFLEKRGIDLTDPQAVLSVLSNPALMNEAANYGFTRGAIIGSLDALSGGLASKTFGGSVRTMVTQLGIQSGLGGTGEALAQLATEGEIDAGEVVLEALGEFATAPIEVVGIGHSAGADKIRKIRNETQATQAAEAYKERLGKILDASGQSKTTTESPELYQEVLERILKDSDVETVRVNAAGLDTFFQAAGTPEQTIEFFKEAGLEEKNIERAVLIGTDLEVDTSKFVSALRAAEIQEGVLANVREDTGAVTLAEAEVASEETQAHVQQAVEELTSDLDGTAETNPVIADANTIRSDITTQARKAGHPRADLIGLMLEQTFLTAQADFAAEGKTPDIDAFYQDMGFQITSEPFTGQQALEQPAVKQPVLGQEDLHILNQEIDSFIAFVREATPAEALAALDNLINEIGGVLNAAAEDPIISRGIEELQRLQATTAEELTVEDIINGIRGVGGHPQF